MNNTDTENALTEEELNRLDELEKKATASPVELADDPKPDDLEFYSLWGVRAKEIIKTARHGIHCRAIDPEAHNQAVEGLHAAERLLGTVYTGWEMAGGPDECRHGIAKGIPCRSCDFDVLKAALAANGKEAAGE